VIPLWLPVTFKNILDPISVALCGLNLVKGVISGTITESLRFLIPNLRYGMASQCIINLKEETSVTGINYNESLDNIGKLINGLEHIHRGVVVAGYS